MTRIRVLYADTDMAGVVYHANYLRYFEAARTDALRDAGVDIARLHLDEHILFAITACDLQFHQPGRYGDTLRIEVKPGKAGPARLVLTYEVWREPAEELCVTGATTIAALNADTGRPVRLPAAMRHTFVGPDAS